MGNSIHNKNIENITRDFLEEEISDEELFAIHEKMQTDSDFADAITDEVVNEYNRTQLKERLQAIDKGISSGKYNTSHTHFNNWWFVPIGIIVAFSVYWFGVRNLMNNNDLSQIVAAKKNKIRDCAFIDSLNKQNVSKHKPANTSEKGNKQQTNKPDVDNKLHENTQKKQSGKHERLQQVENKSNLQIPFLYSKHDINGMQLHCYLVKGKNNAITINQILFDEGKLKKIKEKIKQTEKNNGQTGTYTYIELRHLGVPLNYLKKGEYEYQELLKKVWLQNFRVSKKMENKIKESLGSEFSKHLISPKNTNYFVKNDAISFNWTKNPADTYELSIFTGNLKEVFRKTIDSPVQVNLSFPEGIYYWQLTKGEYTYHTGRFFIVAFPN